MMFCVGGYTSAFTFQPDFRIETDRKQTLQRKYKLYRWYGLGPELSILSWSKPLGLWFHDDSSDIISKIQDFTVAWKVETSFFYHFHRHQPVSRRVRTLSQVAIGSRTQSQNVWVMNQPSYLIQRRKRYEVGYVSLPGEYTKGCVNGPEFGVLF